MTLDDRRSSLPADPEAPRAPRAGIQPWEYARLLAGGDPFRRASARDAASLDRAAPTPVLGTAPHWSHRIRDDLRPKVVIDDEDRLYDEDPFTERFLGRVAHTIVPNQSRYEVDMNRPPNVAIYSTPDLAWGKQVYSDDLDAYDREHTMEKWYEFHSLVDRAVLDAIDRFGYAVLFDIHSYNYQRDAQADWHEDANPEINLGTAHLRLDDEGRRIVDWTLERLGEITAQGEDLRVEENAVFYGGYINRRLSRTFGPRCVTLSVEFKKFFMDELTGEPDKAVLDDVVGQFGDLVAELGAELGATVRDEPRVPGRVPVETG